MSENILEKIIKRKIERIDVLKKSINLNSLNEIIDKNKSFTNFKKKIQNNLSNNKSSIIKQVLQQVLLLIITIQLKLLKFITIIK